MIRCHETTRKQLRIETISILQKRMKHLDTKYDLKKHWTWVSKHNKGVLHIDVHPTLLPRSNMRCDNFHFGCAIGKRLVQYLQNFSLRQD